VISLIYSRRQPVGGFLAAKFPGTENVPRLSDRRTADDEELAFLKSMGIVMATDFHISSHGSGVHSLLTIFNAWRLDPERLYLLQYPESSLHHSVMPELVEWLLRHGRWVAVTHSELFCLRGQAMIRGQRLRPADFSVYVLDEAVDSALDQLSSAVDGLPPYARMRFDEDGDLLDPWPGGFFTERMSELL
jgi:hypothetical protein